MASALCIQFSRPFFLTHRHAAPMKEAQLRTLTAYSFAWQAVYRTITRSSSSTRSTRLDIVKISRPCRAVTTVARPDCTSIGSAHNTIICGYWVGPDDDDGWGYVEAIVYESL